MTCAAIIVAGGSGSRAGGDTPKQYRMLRGIPLLHYAVGAFASHPKIDRVILVIDPAHRGYLGDLPTNVDIVDGGASRTASVRAGLAALSSMPPELVLIHDAARPFVSTAIISGVLDSLDQADGAIPALRITDALVRQTDQSSIKPVDRTGLYRAQTPQGFNYAKLHAAYLGLAEDMELPDDAAVAERAGLSLCLTVGEDENFKVTFPEDFVRAEACLNARSLPVTGSGFDVHRLESGDHMMVCGVRIEDGLSLIGHSDADVALHAVTDAVLGAMGGGDIGEHFPPSDPQWKGKDSSTFLTHAMSLAEKAGLKLSNIDLTLICERPRIGPHKIQMRQRLAELTGLSVTAINVKATTTEGLGFTGRGEGIAAQAIVTGLRTFS